MHIQQNFNVKRHFSIIKDMKRHLRTCTRKTKRKFPGGFYSNPQSVFHILDQFGIYVEEKDRLYEWFLVNDFESILVPLYNIFIRNIMRSNLRL